VPAMFERTEVSKGVENRVLDEVRRVGHRPRPLGEAPVRPLLQGR
jgi:hypothetical protein